MLLLAVCLMGVPGVRGRAQRVYLQEALGALGLEGPPPQLPKAQLGALAGTALRTAGCGERIGVSPAACDQVGVRGQGSRGQHLVRVGQVALQSSLTQPGLLCTCFVSMNESQCVERRVVEEQVRVRPDPRD